MAGKERRVRLRDVGICRSLGFGFAGEREVTFPGHTAPLAGVNLLP